MYKPLFVKNALIHLILIPFYIVSLFEVAKLDSEKLDILLLFVGLIVIAPITSNFFYSYRTKQSKTGLLFGDITTFFSMLVIGMLFVILDVLLLAMIGNVLIFRIALILFWIAVITFDFADRTT